MSVVLKAMSGMLASVLSLLPDSPFRAFIDSVGTIPYIGYLNYFVPVGHFVGLLAVWGAAILGYYAISAILRFVNAIE